MNRLFLAGEWQTTYDLFQGWGIDFAGSYSGLAQQVDIVDRWDTGITVWVYDGARALRILLLD